MESRQSLSQRRRAVTNIGAITKAMEVVAAIKMRKSQEAALNSRPYAFKVLDLLERLSRFTALETSLTKNRPVSKTLILVIASDRGLIGAFNAQVLRTLDNFLLSDDLQKVLGHSYLFATVGKKAEAYLLKKNLPLVGKFYGFGEFIEVKDVLPLFEFLFSGFMRGEWDRVITFSMHFRTALRQETLSRQLLPVDFDKIRETVSEIRPEYGRWADMGEELSSGTEEVDYILEPSPRKLLEELIPHLLKMQLYHLVLEANASEHSARRVAMKNASDNAAELSQKLTIQYNKARQAAITGEIIEISSAHSVLSSNA
jgi:F-type H+-transporting ATPase subunit gamma